MEVQHSDRVIARKLQLWLHGRDVRSAILRAPRLSLSLRWTVLDDLVSRTDVPAWVLRKLSAIVELGPRARRSLRRAAAIAFLRLTDRTCACTCDIGNSERMQVAHAKSLALALPRRLSTPHVVPHLLDQAECATLVAQADAHAAKHGWGSVHRRYPTTDLPVTCLACAEDFVPRLERRVLPLFRRYFGSRYGGRLRFRDLFVAKYDATAQAGLAGHVDSSLLSLIVQLSDDSDFDGGGTCFDHIGLTVHPGQGGAVVFLGKVFHAGLPVTRGCRYILAALVDRVVAADPGPRQHDDRCLPPETSEAGKRP